MNEYLEMLRDWWHRADAYLEPRVQEAWRQAQDAGQRLVAFVQSRRAPRRRPIDPSTRAPSSDPTSSITVITRADEGVMALVDRIEATGGSEVVLIVPREARALRDPAAWPHIAAVAKRNSLALGVVSPRGDIRSFAIQNGLPAATSVKQVVRAPDRRLQLGDREFDIPQIAWGVVIRGVVLLVGIWAVVLVACNTIPSAEVVIVPASEETSVSMRMSLSPIATNADLELRIQPATSFDHTFTHTIAVVTTGEVEVPDERATVILEFSNESDVERLVRAGTAVDDENGITFTTDADVTVPPGEAATIAATAVLAGIQANVPLDTLILSDDLPEGVTVTNQAAASGGTNELVPAVDEADVARASAVADQVLRRIGERVLADVVTGGTVFPQTISVSISSQEALANPGEPADAFLVDYTAIVSALVVTEAQARRTASALLIQSLPPGRALLPGSATAVLADAQVESGTVSVLLTATGLIAEVVDQELVRSAISGESPSTARRELQEMLTLEGTPQITLSPSFVPWRWLPRNAGRITITLAGPASLLALETTEVGGDAGADPDLLTTTDATPAATETPVATETATPTEAP